MTGPRGRTTTPPAGWAHISAAAAPGRIGAHQEHRLDPPSSGTDRLDSWKEIAAYLGRTEKTARRWEQNEGLPVHRLLHQERGSVYAFKGELDAWREARTGRTPGSLSVEPQVRPPVDPPVEPPPRRSPLRVIAWAGLTAALLGGGLLWLKPPPITQPPRTLAVLPFADESSGDIGLGAAIAETVVEHLAGAPDLRIRPFETSARHSRQGEAPIAVARRLGVDSLVTGRVRASTDVLQINVALVDVSDNSQVWAASFDAHESELARVQEHIALAVREQVLRRAYGASFVPEAYQPTNRLSSNPQAVTLFLRSRGFSRNPGRSQIETAIGYLQEAVRLDPEFRAAYEQLAVAHVALFSFGDAPPAQTIARAKEYALEAVRLGSPHGATSMALGGAAHWYDFAHEEAEHHFRVAMAANPEAAGPRSWYAEYLIGMRRFDEAFHALEDAARKDPLWLEVDTVRGNVHLMSGHPELAIPVYLEVLGRDPNHGLSRHFLGVAYLAAGRADEAVAELRRAVMLMSEPPFSMGTLGYALARAGHRTEAARLLDRMMQAREKAFYPAFSIALVHAGLGSHEDALEWLETACDERLIGYYPPNVDVLWDAQRSDPRFQALLRRLNLP
jgi:TolB-like protein/Tfp pilus assembly protein PilF